MQNSFQHSLTPYIKFNELIAKTTEIAITHHIKSVEELTKIGLDNLYAGMNTRTLEDVVSFSKKQPELLKKTSQLLVEKSKAYAKLSTQVYDSTQELFSINLKEMNIKMPTVDTSNYDLGESIVIRKPKKKTTNKVKTPPVSAKSKSAYKAATKKATLTAKKPKAIAKAAPKVEKVASEASKSSTDKPIKVKPAEKTISAKTATSEGFTKVVKTKEKKLSAETSQKLEKTTSPKAIQKNIKPKVTLTNQASKETLVKSVKNESVEKALKTKTQKSKTTANNVDVSSWDKPKSLSEKKIVSEKKELGVTSKLIKPVPKVLSKKISKK